ncbi:MAG: helix-turn-helix transcriptional regulator [Peptococcaceae bacterium]|nr:helix-turn-helix transcriptional regulator [Peptococcaceae bacterium]
MKTKTLAQLRREKRLTQREFAKAVRLHPSTVAMYETGKRTPPLKTAIKIARFFGVPVEAIYFGDDARTTRALQPMGQKKQQNKQFSKQKNRFNLGEITFHRLLSYHNTTNTR